MHQMAYGYPASPPRGDFLFTSRTEALAFLEVCLDDPEVGGA